jgi:hypothetical protein
VKSATWISSRSRLPKQRSARKVIADPDSVWALSQIAAARALDGDRKGALEALRRAREKTKDPAAFSAWLTDEPAFAKFRDAPEFRAMIAPPPDPH